MRTRLLFFSWLSILLLISHGVQAKAPLPADGSFSAKGRVEFLFDSTRKLTINNLIYKLQTSNSSHLFQPAQMNFVQFSVGHPPCWLRFQTENPETHAVAFTAEISNSFLASVQYFILDETGRELTQTSPISWTSPLAARPGQHRNPLINFTVPAGKPGHPALIWVYVRVDNEARPLQIPLRLWKTADFLMQDRQNRLFWGWMIGASGCICLFSLLLFVMLQERIYLQYSLSVFFAILSITAYAGFWIEWFPQLHTILFPAQYLPILFNFLNSLSIILFIGSYALQPVIDIPLIRRLFWASVCMTCLDILFLLTSNFSVNFYADHISWAAPLITLLYFLPILAMYSLTGWVAFLAKGLTHQQRNPAQTYLLAIFPLLVQVGLCLLRNYNVISNHPLLQLEGTALAFLIEFIILSTGLGYRYRLIRQERLRLIEETYRQQQQVIETQLHLQQQETRALEAQLRLQQEKERIARDLHDHVGAQLSVIAANANAPQSITEAPSLIGTYAREAIQSLRDTVWAIDQPAVTISDFRIKLQQYLNRQQQQHPTCTYRLAVDAPTDFILTSAQALNLFRQVQEAVHNAFKYAQASLLEVNCQWNDGLFTLIVDDNGIGFNLSQLTDNQGHYGLRNLQRRAIDLQGECRIKTNPGQGTQVIIKVPISN